ncbi:MAG: N-acetylmuramoyl-L-alanine amidase [Alphaproteobacteria bacterium]|nr:N-acetylmuramoyl-L-alanine amidase [Alphaproteobacteria bacterium]
MQPTAAQRREAPQPEYERRVVVKFQDDVQVPWPPGQQPQYFAGPTARGPQGEWTRVFQGARIERLFQSASAEQLRQMRSAAQAAAGSGERAPNLENFFAVVVPPNAEPEHVVGWASELTGLESAYVQGPPVAPPVAPTRNPRSGNQGYLNAAPVGIDARHAWTLPNGKGQGVTFVDLERGWTLNHEDLTGANIQLISGLNKDYHGHGTAVLGEVLGQDNTLGVLGIAHLATGKVVSQWRTNTNYNTSDAIISAVLNTNAGDVILLEAQTTMGTQQNLPVEVELDTWAAIRVATWLGRIVVEAAGNGGHNLDNFRDTSNKYILKRGHADFRESGAIIVGAASSNAPHRRMNFSCYGSRIDCFGWGENVTTTGDGWTGTSTTQYTDTFSGTSSASPIVAGAAVLVQSMYKRAHNNQVLSAASMRTQLTNALFNTASQSTNDKIGVMPNLNRIARELNIVSTPSDPMGPGDFPIPNRHRMPGDRGQPITAYAGVVLDPGHGGASDAGRSTAFGGRHPDLPAEKDLNLRLGWRVQQALGRGAALTRDGDYNLPLGERIAVARGQRARAFVSLHADSGRSDHAGPEVRVFAEDGRSPSPDSLALAHRISRELGAATGGSVPVYSGPMAVLHPDWHDPGTAACLVEVGSMAHPYGAAALARPGATELLGDAIARGVQRFLDGA